MPPQKYRGYEVEAIQFDGSLVSAKEIIDWIVSTGGLAGLADGYHDHIQFMHRGEPYNVYPSDWVVLDSSYHMETFADAVFHTLYEAVE